MHFHVFTVPEFIACLAVPYFLGMATALAVSWIREKIRFRRAMREMDEEMDRLGW